MLPFLFLHIFGEKKRITMNLVEVGQRIKDLHKKKRGVWHQNTHFITMRIIFISCLH